MTPLKVVSAEGVELILDDGRKLIDAVSSWWSVIHGYNHPVLNRAIQEQVERVSHVMLGGLTHDPALTLAATLQRITPKGLNHVFFSDSGSVGMEVAMKMACQYWQNKGEKQRHKCLAFKKAYHGDTQGVMSIGDPDDGMHALFAAGLQKHVFAEAPSLRDVTEDKAQFDREMAAIDALVNAHKDELAAIVIEPLLQAAGGFNMYDPAYLSALRQLADDHKLLLIFDEVATGFGRTGHLFAADAAGVSPDIMVLSKGLTGGYLGLAATLATDDIFDAFKGDISKTFMHGPTFTGNPIACAVANASIGLFETNDTLKQAAEIEAILTEELQGISHPAIVDTRVMGAVGVIELKSRGEYAGIQAHAVTQNVWLRPFTRYVYTMPAYTITASQLRQVCHAMKSFFLSG